MRRSEVLSSVVNAYTNSLGELVLFARAPNGELRRSIVPGEFTCFFLRSEISPEIVRELKSSRVVRTVREDGDYLRVVWRDRDVLKRLSGKEGLFDKRELRSFEADVDPVRRWLTDHPAIEIQKPRRVYLDIETDSRVGFAQKHTSRCLCWTLEDDDGNQFEGLLLADDQESETALLKELWRNLERYDQVIAWNGDRFDFEYLRDRSEYLQLPVEFKRWLWLDHMVLFRRMNVSASESGEEKQSFALEAVARVLLGEGKLRLEEEELELLEADETIGNKTWELWAGGKLGRDALVRYCRRDTNLLRQIEEKTGYIDLLLSVCQACATFPDSRGINPTNQVEGFLMRLGAGRGMRFRTHRFSEDTTKFRGAYVMDPARELHTGEIHVCDFAGMYPSILISWNMSPETLTTVKLVENIENRPSYLRHLPPQRWPLPPGHTHAPFTDKVFRAEPQGILAEALIEIRRLRAFWTKKKAEFPPGTAEWKEADRRSTAYKVTANTFYGVISSPFSRFFDRDVGESCTQTGVWLIKQTEAAAIARGWRVIYIDTDALYVIGCSRAEFEGFVDWCNDELYPRLLREQGCAVNLVKLEYEKAFKRICFVSAKRYIAMFAHYKGKEATADSKPEIKGLEFKRGDSLKLARDLQKSVAYAILGYQQPAVDEPAAIEPIVNEFFTRVFEATLVFEEVKQSKKLAKPIADYARKEKQAPPMHKLRGEEIVAAYSEHECEMCGAVPRSMLTIRAGKCDFCDGELKKKRSFARGIVLANMGERIAVTDGRKTVFVFVDTIDELKCLTSLPQHVEIARMLISRGRDIGKGSRVEFVTVDADDPFGVIPAEDWQGEADRFDLWEKTWAPTKRLLEAAWPNWEWSKFDRRRPKKIPDQVAGMARVAPKRTPDKKRPSDRNSGQGSLF